MENTTKSLWSQMHEMPKGGEICVSLSDYSHRTGRTYASELGLKLGRKFKTRLDRATMSYFIIRVS